VQILLGGQDIAQALAEEGMIVNYHYFNSAHQFVPCGTA
jgi:hypothetical protein